MPDSITHPRLSRRLFVSLAGAGAASLALPRTSRAADTEALAAKHSRVGISDAAFQNAHSRAQALVAQMTLEEKISQTSNKPQAVPRLGVPAYAYYSGEAMCGLLLPGATGLPTPLAMGWSWNPDLVRKGFAAVAAEARGYHSKYNHGLSYYSPPTLNIHRDPRWGRCGEVYGEDPCHLASFAVAVVRGFQGDDPQYLKAIPCAKHFICNNTDDDRQTVSASVDPRSFWEYYTRAYRAAAVEGDVFAFMGAYNAINGTPCCADHFLLTELLRNRWGFRGYVTSDCGAIANICRTHHYVPTLSEAAGVAVKAGCDFNCGDTLPKYLKQAVALGYVSEEEVTRAVVRTMTTRFLLGLFDPPETVPYNKISFNVVNSTKHQQLALALSRQSLVLLKNKSQFLPLDKSNYRKVAIIGPMAHYHAGDYANNSPGQRISILDGLAAEFGVQVQRRHTWAADAVKMSQGLQSQASSEGGTDVGWIKPNSWMEFAPQNLAGVTEFKFRLSSYFGGHIAVHLDHLASQPVAAAKVAATHGNQNWITVTAPVDKPLQGTHRIFLRCTGFNIEWFEVSPHPKSAATETSLVYEPGCSVMGPKDALLFKRAVAAASEADVVIMACGAGEQTDREAHDRNDTGLPGAQHELIEACYRANPKTVLVLNTNNTLAVNWEQDNLPAIVSAIFAGQAQGTAVADVLFGQFNPCGKTSCTWYKSVDQLPPFHDYDITKGRTYMYFKGEPLYPFGHGLSYTQFKFSKLSIAGSSLAAGQAIRLSATITNIGKRSGAEVVQFYVALPPSPVARPARQLVGFARVELKPRQSKRVTFSLPYNEQALWYWHEAQQKFALQPGLLKIMLGSSSADIHLSGEILLRAAPADLGGPESLTSIGCRATLAL
ncbi:MAG: carbohydrate-binding protein [Phycisphaerales bacterium]|nr:carbohydrate-binding protein [Phycisphaerales bacterium]